ncbi:MAG: hypothetical protein KIT84_23085 [Labilithrix sp.]|nr:hypothetical protein [Labilithrix sp.]MCW5813931.1 hypothetical protein [Labilithrix sp.]
MRRGAVVGALSFLLGACAANKPPPAAEPASPAMQAPPPMQAQPYAPRTSPQGYPQPGYAPPPPTTPSRQAGADFDKAQRELEVAAGDCTNACRALSSMDRAAGRICSLTSGSDEDAQRCNEAKARVYSARDKVKSTCGNCPDTSVERSAPVPSTK